MNAECCKLLCFGPRKLVATNQIISGISFRELMKFYSTFSSNMAIREFVEQEMVCVVRDNEVLVMFVIPVGKDTARNISHTVRTYLLKEEIN
jgi:hypothetical protein